MHLFIFAGGAGTRLWPLSRRSAPKQFAKIFEGKSTLQLAVERVRPFGVESVFVCTAEAYADTVREQLPELAEDHVMTEPARRDLGAAVAYHLLRAHRRGARGPIALLWADHLMQRPDVFVDALKRAEKMVTDDRDRIVFLGEQPRFPNHNLGWIHVGDERIDGTRAFLGWKYRPELDVCKAMFERGEWLWNPGYFIFDIETMLDLYRRHQPELMMLLGDMVDGRRSEADYAQAEKLSFDEAVIERMAPEHAVVIPVSMGWSDPGTLYAMKEALTQTPDGNLHRGAVMDHGSRDGFVYNECDDRPVVTVGLDGVIVVNAPDVVLVCHKDAVPEIKPLLARLEAEGFDHLL